MKKRVLIVDDSASVRMFLKTILNMDGRFEIAGEAEDPFEAVKILKADKSIDVITLDVEMPRMNGLEFLQRLMKQRPIPTVMFSTLTNAESLVGIEALKLGAIDVLQKPNFKSQEEREEKTILLCDKLYAAAFANLDVKLQTQKILEKNKVVKGTRLVPGEDSDEVILVGSSTGGPETLRKLFSNVAVNLPGVLITQHMPDGFVDQLALSLDKLTHFKVQKARGNELIKNNHIYIAPGDKHLEINKLGDKYFTRVKEGPLVSRHRPSVDVLFDSASKIPGEKLKAIILTGMGQDGAQGMLNLKNNGVHTIAQDRSSSVVYGMPRQAILKGGVVEELSLIQIANYLNKSFK